MIVAQLQEPALNRNWEYVEAAVVKRLLLGYGLDDSLLTFRSVEDANLALPFMLRALNCPANSFELVENDEHQDTPEDISRVRYLAEQFLANRRR